MEPQVLQERLTKILGQNGVEDCSGTMPEGLREAFDGFIMVCGIKFASSEGASGVPLAAIIGGTLEQGFWLGHDYALEHGQLRGD